ncbi:hypothetical protein QQL38_09835 [Pseudomonas syringae]|uniref:hypothetical protein n=1 Tax=Pseudomonas syringae TaxID=317 RepID=UPI0020BDC0A6|nr:hypothetical protein [Pseudomonas syringae]MCL6306990.1 hypothetical protein [Pseudomonas syringae]
MSKSKVDGFFRAVVMWLLFAVFLIIGLLSMFSSFLSGLIMLLAACVFLPQINRMVKDQANITITSRDRVVVVLVCIGLFLYTLNRAQDADRAERSVQTAIAAQQKAEQDKKEKREYVAANKDAILQEMNSFAAKQDYAGATALGTKYSNAGNFEIDQALSKISVQKAEAEKQQRKATLLASLASTQQNDYAGLAKTYTQLATVDPSYQANAEKYSKLAEQRTQEARAHEQAAAYKARQKSLGLTWNYTDSEDNMSGKPVRRAYVLSTNTVDFDFPYSGVQKATLTIRKHPRWGTSVYISIEKGQFVCGYDDCNVRVRFAKDNAKRVSASAPEDGSSTTLFINNESSFISQARKSDKVYIEAGFYQEGNRIFEFDISDLEWK